MLRVRPSTATAACMLSSARRCFSTRGVPSTAAVLRSMLRDGSPHADLAAQLASATPLPPPASTAAPLLPLATPEAEAARKAWQEKQTMDARARDKAAAKAALIEQARWERHHSLSAEESTAQTSRAFVPMAPDELNSQRGTAAAPPPRPRTEAEAAFPEARLRAAATASSAAPSFAAPAAPRSSRPSSASAAGAVAGGPSPFKQFNPYFDYEAALVEHTHETARQREKQQAQSAARREREALAASLSEAVHKERSIPRAQQQSIAAARRSAAASAEPSTRRTAPLPPRPAAAVAAPTSRPGAPKHVINSAAASSVSSSADPAVQRARLANLMESAGRWSQSDSDKTVPHVPVAGMKSMRAAKVFQRPDAPDVRAQAAGPDNSPDAAAAAKRSARPARGPGTPADILASNKFPLGEVERQKLADEAEAERQAAIEAERAKQEEIDVQRRKQRAKASLLTPDKDGKLPLQPPGSSKRPAAPLPSHPALYLKNFLAKIHPDLMHSSGADTQPRVHSDDAASSADMVALNQSTVAKFNAIVDYYKQIKTLGKHEKHIPNTPVIPPHPDSLAFYCRVKETTASAEGAAAKEDEEGEADSDAPTIVKHFDANWSPSAFDLSSLARLVGYIETLLMRLLLASEAGIHLSVRKRWEVQLRSRALSERLWSEGVEDDNRAAGGYLSADPTGSSMTQSPGQFQRDYLSYYAQTADSHSTIRRSHGVRTDAPELYAPDGPESKALSPLLESMLRSGLLRFDERIDMLQRLQCLQGLMRLLHGPRSRDLYIHLWAGVHIYVTAADYSLSQDDFNYRYAVDSWSLPWDFDEAKLRSMITQYIYAFHADAEKDGVRRLEQTREHGDAQESPTVERASSKRASAHKRGKQGSGKKNNRRKPTREDFADESDY